MNQDFWGIEGPRPGDAWGMQSPSADTRNPVGNNRSAIPNHMSSNSLSSPVIPPVTPLDTPVVPDIIPENPVPPIQPVPGAASDSMPPPASSDPFSSELLENDPMQPPSVMQSDAEATPDKPHATPSADGLPPDGHTYDIDDGADEMEEPENNYYSDSFDEDGILHEKEFHGSSRLWSDSDYPFFPKPRKGKPKGVKKSKALRQPRFKGIRIPRSNKGKCPKCGSIIVDGICLICKLFDACPRCHRILSDGICTNPLCPKSEKRFCPECGEVMPCNCGVER